MSNLPVGAATDLRYITVSKGSSGIGSRANAMPNPLQVVVI
jgi:hypothetical protein